MPFTQQQQSLAQINRQGSTGSVAGFGRGGNIAGASGTTSGPARAQSMWQSQAGAPRAAGQATQPVARPGVPTNSNASPQAGSQGGWRRAGEPAGQTPSMSAPAARNVPAPQIYRPPVDSMRQDRGAAAQGGATSSGPTSSGATSSGSWRRFGDAPQAGAPSQSMRGVQPSNQPQLNQSRLNQSQASRAWQ